VVTEHLFGTKVDSCGSYCLLRPGQPARLGRSLNGTLTSRASSLASLSSDNDDTLDQDHGVDLTAYTLRATFDPGAPLPGFVVKPKRSAPGDSAPHGDSALAATALQAAEANSKPRAFVQHTSRAQALSAHAGRLAAPPPRARHEPREGHLDNGPTTILGLAGMGVGKRAVSLQQRGADKEEEERKPGPGVQAEGVDSGGRVDGRRSLQAALGQGQAGARNVGGPGDQRGAGSGGGRGVAQPVQAMLDQFRVSGHGPQFGRRARRQ
jgi:hypothetical protein